MDQQDYKALRAIDPFRQPDWRHDRAIRLHQRREKGSRFRDDQLTLDYLKFLRRYHTAENLDTTEIQREYAHTSLAYSNPKFYFAYSFRYVQERMWRDQLEAMVLARESDQSIAHRFGTLPEVITTYRDLYYDVADRLDCDSYILCRVIGEISPQGYGALDAHSRFQICKLYAYYGGPLVLDVMLTGLIYQNRPASAEAVSSWLNDAVQTSLQRNAALGAHSTHVEMSTVLNTCSVYSQLQDASRRAKDAAGKTTEYQKHILSFMSSIEFQASNASLPGESNDRALLRESVSSEVPNLLAIRGQDGNLALRNNSDSENKHATSTRESG